ncbi:hypothetical protein AVEN_130045-1 [Araneus ventricosus]|uniref:Uncharacterized protein n=1 Tax=Araneus ventricosus TaxID=182803 RepID=A0A4Y2DEF2_ARAVE|nr:hypothetical protein AVEN_130045-1 [Araneus ventricosus]
MYRNAVQNVDFRIALPIIQYLFYNIRGNIPDNIQELREIFLLLLSTHSKYDRGSFNVLQLGFGGYKTRGNLKHHFAIQMRKGSHVGVNFVQHSSQPFPIPLNTSRMCRFKHNGVSKPRLTM